MDRLTKKQRSRLMSRIKSKWTGPERFAHNILKGNRVRHRMHAAELPGTPDIAFDNEKIAVFIDGCFWHGHGHCRIPENEFWQEKIRKNKARDRRDARRLRKMGWAVRRIWECRLTGERLLIRAPLR